MKRLANTEAKGWLLILILWGGLKACPTGATVHMAQNPYWAVGIASQFPTGIGWGDFDNNGWPDLAVTRGLDVVKLPKHIYCNWSGQIDTVPGWTSGDLEAGDNVSIGDLDNDGDLDLLVSHLGITATGMDPVPAVVYYNNGGLSQNPGWYSQPANSFSSALGDPDGDGDLDVAVGQGDWATSHKQRQAIYRNNGGVLDTVPWWQSDSTYYVCEIHFIDIDGDGDQDLATGHGHPGGGVMIFYNNNGTIETTPSRFLQTSHGARQFDFGDVDGNGCPDLVVASPVSGYFLFLNHGGVLDSLPSWSKLNNNEPCCVDLADIDGDSDLDLAAGAWASPLVIYENNGGTFNSQSAWSYSDGYRVEQVCWGDADGDGTVDAVEKFAGNGTRKLFNLSKTPLYRINSVSVNGNPLPLADYCYHLADSWVSLRNPVVSGETLAVNYRFSQDLDLVAAHGVVMIFKNKSNILASISPPSRVITSGDTVEYTVILQRQYGSYGPIALTTEVSPLPLTGTIQLSFNNDSIYSSDTVTLTAATTATISPGRYAINVVIPVGADTIVTAAALEVQGSGQAVCVGADHAMMDLVRGIWGTVDSLWSTPSDIGPNYQGLIIEHGGATGDTMRIRQYIEGGGMVLLTRKSPYELCGSTSLASISGWIGASGYATYTGTGIAIISTYEQPFGTTIHLDDTLGTAVAGFGRLSGLGANGVRLARLSSANTLMAGVTCSTGSGHCMYYTGGAGIAPKSDSLLVGFLRHPQLGVGTQPNSQEVTIDDLGLSIFPNPLRTSAIVSFHVKEHTRVRVDVYDILGRAVRKLADGVLPPGRHAIRWDGLDGRGRRVAAGVYFIRGKCSGSGKIQRLTVVR